MNGLNILQGCSGQGIATTITSTLNEMHPAHHGITQQVLNPEHQWLSNHAMNDQFMFFGIDFWNAVVVTLEMQSAGRYGSVKRLKWRARSTRSRRYGGITRSPYTLDLFFKL